MSLAFALALIALPSLAHAGTSTTNGTATFNVTSQCSVTGATVNLGTYRSDQTWWDLPGHLGWYLAGYQPGLSGQGINPGSRGFEYANFGSVTCGAGTPYSLIIKGTGTQNRARLNVNGKVAAFLPAIKRLGGVVVPDNLAPNYAGSGHQMAFGPLSGVGTGATQALIGNIVIDFAASESTVLVSDKMGAPGTFTDPLTYTLTF